MDIDLDELERLAKAATPGPWKDKSYKRNYDWGVICSGGKRIAICASKEVTDKRKNVTFDEMLANAAYIVAACNAVPELVARVREMERQRLKFANLAICNNGCLDCPLEDVCLYQEGTVRDSKICSQLLINWAEQEAKEAGE